MTKHPFTLEQANQAMELLEQSFRLFPLPDVSPPTPGNESDFLAEHPQYVSNGQNDAIAWLMASDKEIITGLSPQRQNLATTLMTTVLTEKDFLEIAKKQ